MAVALAFPWSGHAWGPASSATGILGGGAATPVAPGTGFNWASIVQGKIGGPVSGYIQNYRGVPVNATFVKRYTGLRGLGQTCLSPCFDNQAICCDDPSTIVQGGGGGGSSTTTPGTNWASIFTPLSTAAGAVAKQLISYQNPLLQKATVVQNPQGVVTFASDVSTGIPGLTTANLSSYMPIILIGGLLLVVMMGARR